MTRSYSSIGVAIAGAITATPALLTRTSMPPRPAAASSTDLRTDAGSVASASRNRAVASAPSSA